MRLEHGIIEPLGGDSSQIAIRVLGTVAVRTRDGDWLAIRSRREAVVLARIALSETVVSDMALAEAIWGDQLPATWNASLRNAVTKLRSIVRDSSDGYDIERVGDGYRLELAGDTIDLEMVDQILSHMSRELETSPANALMRLSQIRLALNHSLDPSIISPWAEPIERRIEEKRRRTLQLLANSQMAAGQPESAVATAMQLIAENEFDEAGYRLAMRAQFMAGQRVNALRAYEQCRLAMRDEFGVAPSEETEALHLTLLGKNAESSLPGNLSRHLVRVLAGREDELRRLQRGWSTVCAGESVWIAVTGNAGIGKTRLLAELARGAAEDGGHVCYGAARSDEPLGLLARALSVEAHDIGDGAEIAERLRRLCKTAPTLLALDDLHEASEASLRAVDELIRLRIPGLAIVGLSHGSSLRFDHRAMNAADMTIDLGGLDANAIAEVIRSETGTAPDVNDAQQVASDMGGNPLYVIEILANGLSEALSLSYPDQGGLPDLPPAIRRVVNERVDVLSKKAQHVVDAAAVLATNIEVRTILEMVDLDASTALDAISEAQRAGLLSPVVGQPGSFRFVDAVTRLAIELELPWGQRVSLHQRAARTLEADPLVGQASPHLLAHHYGAAALLGCWRECVRWTRVAVDHAETNGRHAEAAVRLGDTLFSLAEAGDPDPKVRVEFEIDLALALGRFGAPEAVEVARDAHRAAIDQGATAAAASLRRVMRRERLVPTGLVDELDRSAASVEP